MISMTYEQNNYYAPELDRKDSYILYYKSISLLVILFKIIMIRLNKEAKVAMLYERDCNDVYNI